jgi:hypothetical protein
VVRRDVREAIAKWFGQFLGEFPINFLPSSFVGKAVERGVLHPEWVTVGKGHRVCGRLPQEGRRRTIPVLLRQRGLKVLVKSPKRLGIGESTSFTIDRCNV